MTCRGTKVVICASARALRRNLLARVRACVRARIRAMIEFNIAACRASSPRRLTFTLMHAESGARRELLFLLSLEEKLAVKNGARFRQS